jgi:hypothetical protein
VIFIFLLETGLYSGVISKGFVDNKCLPRQGNGWMNFRGIFLKPSYRVITLLFFLNLDVTSGIETISVKKLTHTVPPNLATRVKFPIRLETIKKIRATEAVIARYTNALLREISLSRVSVSMSKSFPKVLTVSRRRRG